MITTQESSRQDMYRHTLCTVKWVWIPWKGNTSVVMMRALLTLFSPQFIYISKTETWREFKWGRVLAVSLRRLFICTRLLGKAEKRWSKEKALQYTRNFSFLRKWSTEPVFQKSPPDTKTEFHWLVKALCFSNSYVYSLVTSGRETVFIT